MITRYRVDMVPDHPDKLSYQVEKIGEQGRKVVSVIWQPSRTTASETGERIEVDSGYVVVSERDFT